MELESTDSLLFRSWTVTVRLHHSSNSVPEIDLEEDLTWGFPAHYQCLPWPALTSLPSEKPRTDSHHQFCLHSWTRCWGSTSCSQLLPESEHGHSNLSRGVQMTCFRWPNFDCKVLYAFLLQTWDSFCFCSAAFGRFPFCWSLAVRSDLCRSLAANQYESYQEPAKRTPCCWTEWASGFSPCCATRWFEEEAFRVGSSRTRGLSLCLFKWALPLFCGQSTPFSIPPKLAHHLCLLGLVN